MTIRVVPTIAKFAALDAVLVDLDICAPWRYLLWAEACCTQPSRTCCAFPWRTFCLLQLDPPFAILTQIAGSLFAPLLLETHRFASPAPILRHVPFLGGLPIDVVTTQLLHKQRWAFCWGLREQLTLEGSLNEKLSPVSSAHQRNIAGD